MRSRKSIRAALIEAVEPRQLLSTIYVDANATGATHNGASWNSAYQDLQQGLATAVSGDEIHVADGTYKPTSGTDRKISFALKSGVKLFGGYAGFGEFNPDTRNTNSNLTILSGDIGTSGAPADNSYQVVTATGINAAATMDGFTVTLGNANRSGRSEVNGGGLFVINSYSVTLANCTFIENIAIEAGGGIYGWSSSMTLTNCRFIANTARKPSGRGGGMYADSSLSATLSNCTFDSNQAGNGAGLFNGTTSLVLDNCDFNANTALSGGGIYNDQSSSGSLRNCHFSNNSVPGGGGGGIYNGVYSSPSLFNCTFDRNTASQGLGGGMMTDNDSSPKLTNCKFDGNIATQGGGMFMNAKATPSLTNCSCVGNSANVGGGVYNFVASPVFLNCAFIANVSSDGGAVYYHSASSPGFFSSMALINCVVWGNGDTPIYNTLFKPTITYSDIQGGYDGIGNINADPRLVKSPWTGADGLFGSSDDNYGDLRLRNDSPCLNAGFNSIIPSGVNSDLAGNPRIQAGVVDLGVYEGAFASPPPTTIYVDTNSVGTNEGISWTDAFRELQSAIFAASDGDIIRIADGLYKPTSGADREITFALKSGVRIYGGFAGYGAGNPDARDSSVFATILSGDVGAVGNATDNSYHVVTAAGTGGAIVMDGINVISGNASGGVESQERGGGLHAVSSASLIFSNCMFGLNTANRGGACYNSNSSPLFTNCRFVGNQAQNGGGMYNDQSATPVLNNCSFASNDANLGGGLYVSSGSPIITHCTFEKNLCSGNGAGIYNDAYSTPVVTYCNFIGNVSGAGIYNSYGSAPIIANCNFVGNISYSGAGIFNYNSSAIVTNCTFSENTTYSGSAGGGMFNDTASPIITNCIFWEGSIGNAYASNPIITHSDVQGGYIGAGNIDADPHFIRNPSPGADGTWGTADDDYGDLRLQANSPCIDAGSNAAVQAGVATDLAGNPRIVDAPGVRDFGERVDMGAYEYLPALTYQADAAKPTLRMSFAFDVNPTTLSASDLVLLNLTSGQPLSTSGAVVSYDSSTRVATWQFSGVLPDGDYRATLPAGSVSDTSGTPLASDSLCNFFALGGDANRDRLVDIKDLYILASNWSGDNKLFSQGDFNYDGKVDANDLAVLSAHWQQNLASPVAAAPVSLAKVAKRSPVRMVSVVG